MNMNLTTLLPLIMNMNGGGNPGMTELLKVLVNQNADNGSGVQDDGNGFNPMMLMLMAMMSNNRQPPKKQQEKDNFDAIKGFSDENILQVMKILAQNGKNF